MQQNIRWFILIIILQINLFNYSVSAQAKWELKKNQNEIFVYTSSIVGSNIKAFRSVTTLKNTSFNEICSAILDVGNYVNLFPDTKSCKLLSKSSDGNKTHYLQSAAPWPVDDRDGVYELTTTFNKELKQVTTTINCIKSDYPRMKGTVRMEKGSGFWQVTELKNGAFEVIYQYHSEPGGAIPAWLANSAVVSIPYQTLENLKKIIATGKYKNNTVDFLN